MEQHENRHERITLQVLDDTVKQSLKNIFGDLEEKLCIEGLSVALYTVIMELVGNAVKANLKRAYFKENNINPDDTENYIQAVQSFKDNYEQLQKERYRSALESLELIVTIEIDLDNDRLLTFVENNTIMLAEEEKRVRKKLGTAMESDELADFFMHYGDDMEGSGLGLAMIVFLIREIGFNPDNFRVYYKENKTVARLEFPLHADYVPIRERGKLEKERFMPET